MSINEVVESVEYLMATLYTGVSLTVEQYESLRAELINKLCHWERVLAE